MVFLLVLALSVPDIIEVRDETPVWVAAEHALNPDGSLRYELFGGYDGTARHNAPLNREGRCERFSGSIPSHFERNQSLTDLANFAKVIVSGTAKSVRQGFLQGMPGMLIALSGDVLRGDQSLDVFLFYPLSAIETTDGIVCAKPVVPYFFEPKTGDRFLVFYMLPPRVIGTRVILRVHVARELVHEREGLKPMIPRSFPPELTTFQAIETRVREILGR